MEQSVRMSRRLFVNEVLQRPDQSLSEGVLISENTKLH